jgi:prepilin-type processing-associated H-X9-DG protein
MRNQIGLTRIDVAVALVCIALVLGQAGIINAGGRSNAKLQICLANLKTMANAWQIYASDNSGKVPVGDVWYSWAFPIGSSGGPQLAWAEWPHPFPHSMPPTATTNAISSNNPIFGADCAGCKQSQWEHAIAEGTMWKYVKEYNIYRCPAGVKNQFVTYRMSRSMNTYPGSGGTGVQPAPQITNINQIIKPAEKLVFIDNGSAAKGAFFTPYSVSKTGSGPGLWWGDLPPVPHNQGTTFAFADGHVEYRQWTDPHALAAIESGVWGGGTVDNCDCDLRWMVQVTWGDIPYDCNNPDKQCEY